MKKNFTCKDCSGFVKGADWCNACRCATTEDTEHCEEFESIGTDPYLVTRFRKLAGDVNTMAEALVYFDRFESVGDDTIGVWSIAGDEDNYREFTSREEALAAAKEYLLEVVDEDGKAVGK